MNKEKLIRKFPLITFVVELILISTLLICTLYGYHELLGEGPLKGLLKNSLPDDVITGWFVFPAMILQVFGALGYIVIVVVAVIHLGLVMLSMGWNMWIVKQNKDNKYWVKAVGILPAGLLALKVVKRVSPICMVYGNILNASYMMPAIVILIETIVYTQLVQKYQI